MYVCMIGEYFEKVNKFELMFWIVAEQCLSNWKVGASIFWYPKVSTQITGPPRPIFGRQGRHSGGHINGVLPLLTILQNPALGVLSAVAALHNNRRELIKFNCDFMKFLVPL